MRHKWCTENRQKEKEIVGEYGKERTLWIKHSIAPHLPIYSNSHCSTYICKNRLQVRNSLMFVIIFELKRKTLTKPTLFDYLGTYAALKK